MNLSKRSLINSALPTTLLYLLHFDSAVAMESYKALVVDELADSYGTDPDCAN